MLKNLTFWAEIDEIDGFLVIFYSSKMLVHGLTTNGHHKSFFCYLFYVAIYMRYLKSVVRPLVLFFWEVCVSGLQCGLNEKRKKLHAVFLHIRYSFCWNILVNTNLLFQKTAPLWPFPDEYILYKRNIFIRL